MELIERIIEKFLTKHISEFYFVGSRITCLPAPKDTDIDIICLLPNSHLGPLKEDIELLGFEIGGSRPINELSGLYESEFISLKLGDYNLIITGDRSFFEKFLLATRISTKLNLMKKEDRIALFQAILYGNG